MMLALRPVGRGDLAPGRLNALRMELERAPKSGWRGAASRTLLSGSLARAPLRTLVGPSEDFGHHFRPLATPSLSTPSLCPLTPPERVSWFLTPGLPARGLGSASWRWPRVGFRCA